MACSYCCHMRVVATIPEVVQVVEWFNTRLGPEELESLRSRVASTDDVTHGMSDEEWGKGRFQCPLLVDGICSAYAVRPLDCRSHNSTNKAACQVAMMDYEEWDVPSNPTVQAVYKHAQSGVLAGLQANGLPSRLVEFVAGLRIALEDDEAISRWHRGGNVFEAAELDPADPEQLAFSSEPTKSRKVHWICSDEFREDGEFYFKRI